MITTENVTFAIILIGFFSGLLLVEAVIELIKKFKKK